MDDNVSTELELPELVTEFVVGGVRYPSQLPNHLRIDRNDLNAEFQRHAEVFAWYSTLYEMALDAETRLKSDLERKAAWLDYRTRQEMDQSGIKVTETKVLNTVITHQEYRLIQDAYFEAKKQTGLIKAARDAMIHKRDMLIGLGANWRAENNSDPSLRAYQYRQSMSE